MPKVPSVAQRPFGVLSHPHQNDGEITSEKARHSPLWLEAAQVILNSAFPHLSAIRAHLLFSKVSCWRWVLNQQPGDRWDFLCIIHAGYRSPLGFGAAQVVLIHCLCRQMWLFSSRTSYCWRRKDVQLKLSYLWESYRYHITDSKARSLCSWVLRGWF